MDHPSSRRGIVTTKFRELVPIRPNNRTNTSVLMLTLLAQNAPQESMLSAALKWPATPLLIFSCGGMALMIVVFILAALLFASARRRE